MRNNYKVIHYYSKTDDRVLAFAPELPDCFADGHSLIEAVDNLDSVGSSSEDNIKDYIKRVS